jgi:hypothetical protein
LEGSFEPCAKAQVIESGNASGDHAAKCEPYCYLSMSNGLLVEMLPRNERIDNDIFSA